MIRFSPSNSSNLTGGGGSIGTSRMTDDSTCGGGLKSFRDTLMMLSTLAQSYRRWRLDMQDGRAINYSLAHWQTVSTKALFPV